LQIGAGAAEDVALELGLSVGERDEVEPDVAEHERVPPLRHANHGVGQWAPTGVGDGHGHPCTSVCVAARARNDDLGHGQTWLIPPSTTSSAPATKLDSSD